MSKYTALSLAVSSIFASPEWESENIIMVPATVVIEGKGTEWCRVSVIPAGSVSSNPYISVSGQIIIDIFTSAGRGSSRALEIADILDKHLVAKEIDSAGGSLQLLSSSLHPRGVEKHTGLDSTKYSINFNYFGVN